MPIVSSSTDLIMFGQSQQKKTTAWKRSSFISNWCLLQILVNHGRSSVKRIQQACTRAHTRTHIEWTKHMSQAVKLGAIFAYALISFSVSICCVSRFVFLLEHHHHECSSTEYTSATLHSIYTRLHWPLFHFTYLWWCYILMVYPNNG